MNAFSPITLRRLLEPDRLLVLALLVSAVAIGIFIPMSDGMKMQFRAILTAGLAGFLAFLVIPNRRIALVCAWVLVHPLSLEKIFPFLSSTHKGFLENQFLLSGADLVLSALIANLFLEIVTERRLDKVSWPRAATPYALIVAWAVVLFFAITPTSNGFMQVYHWVKMLVFLLVFSSSIRTRHEFITVLVAAAIAVLIQSILLGTSYAMGQKLGFSSKVTSEAMMSFSGGSSEQGIKRATGTVGHVNQQAMFHVLFTIPVIALVMARNWIWRVFGAFVLLASFSAILLTFSRASWISCVIAVTVIVALAWHYKRISRFGWLGLVCGLLVALIVVGALSGRIITRITKGDDGASSSRIRMAMLALNHATSHPITGVGPGNFINAQVAAEPIQWASNTWLPRGYSYRPRYVANLELYEIEILGKWYYAPGVVHNKFLLMVAEFGIVGLGLFLWFQWRLLCHALKSLRARDPLLWWSAVALVGAFFANQSEYMFELFYDDKTVLMPLFVASLIIALDRIVAAENASMASSPNRPLIA